LNLSYNQLNGGIPRNLNKLAYLNYLNLGYNQLSGKIPPEIGKLDSLKSLSLDYNQLSGSIPIELFKLSNLNSLWLRNNQLEGEIPAEIGNLTQLTNFHLRGNQLSGTIPAEIGNLKELSWLDLSHNQFSGSIPVELSNLNNLYKLILSYNELSGTIPNLNYDFGYLEHNRFRCIDIAAYFENNDPLPRHAYSPQYFTPANYEDVELQILDSLQFGNILDIPLELPNLNSSALEFQWVRNEYFLSNADEKTYQVENIQTGVAGEYTLEINQNNCLPSGESLKLISDPMYVIIKGYDLYGQSVAYNQIMVQFNTPEETEKYELEILTPNAGWVKEACNCNRELYLWQFPSTEDAIAALLAIDEKTKIIKKKNRPKGGFNNNLNIGKTSDTYKAYNIVSDLFNNNYPDSVSIFILDSGLDEQNYNAAPFLNKQAAVDGCYEIEKSPGYSYVDSISTITPNYSDNLWHGTFGFRSITNQLEGNANLNLVPLKIFNKNGEGTLFDMVCALYHAIDHNADIVNISAGYQGEPSEILESAINLARGKGIFITAAAGNDTLNIDNTPQYPAYYTSQYYKFEIVDTLGNVQLDSLKYENVISVASINAQDSLSHFSNYGKQSVTIATYGENIYSYGLEGLDVVASGSSMATYFATKTLALEIAKDNKRNYQDIWNDFESNWLIENPSLLSKTQTSKQINLTIEEPDIEGCTDPYSPNYFIFATIDDGTCITDVTDNHIENNFKIYPNPSNGSVYLSFNEPFSLFKKIEVYDSSGRRKLSTNLYKDNKLNISGYADGIYFIKVSNNYKSMIRKLVIK